MFDLVFIVFDSANLSLAFDSLFDVRWSCRSAVLFDEIATVLYSFPPDRSGKREQCSADNPIPGKRGHRSDL